MEEEIRSVYKIGKFRFNSEEEYFAAKRDLDKIAKLKIKKEMNYSEVKEVLRLIEENEISFEGRIGEEFVKSVKHRIYQYHRFWKRRVFQLICVFIMAGCSLFFITDGVLEWKSRRSVEEVRQQVAEAAKQEENSIDSLKNEEKIQGNPVPEEIKNSKVDEQSFSFTDVKPEDVLPEYQPLYEQNPYFAGWLKVEDTGLDYPVMQGPDNEYYLSHNIKNEYDKNGLLILDAGCFAAGNSPQYIIYGHNVQSGRMFGELLNYKEEAYYRFHPVISFDTLTKKSTYEIAAVFITSLADTQKLSRFYEYRDLESQEEFENYIDEMKEASLYETDFVPSYGKPLLLLVTCENSVEDGRLVVVAGEK